MKKSEIIFGSLRLPMDYLFTVISMLLAYRIRPITDLIPGVQYHFGPELLPEFKQYLLFTLIASLFLTLLFGINGQYSLKVSHRFLKSLFKVGYLVTVWMMFIIVYYFLIIHELFYSRIALIHTWIFTVVLISIGRGLIQLAQRYLLKHGVGKRRILFLGQGELTKRLYALLKEKDSYQIAGALSDEVKSQKKGELKTIGLLNNYQEIISRLNIEEIIQTKSFNKKLDQEIYNFCMNYQVKYQFVPSLIRLQKANIESRVVGSIPLIRLKESTLDGWGYIFKRLFDVVFTLILMLVLIPIWLLVPIAIMIDSRGPILYKSKRKYKNKVFGIYKFRSMVTNADKIKKDLMDKNERKGPLFKIKNDPRITKVGRFLRKTSIDELPQLINVLKGELSLVGPRPHLPEEIDQYEHHHKKVFAIKPGITGLAQISGRSNLDFEKEVELDVQYIQNWSIWLDIKIIIKSALVVLKADGA